MEDDAAANKVSYLIKLLGRKRTSISQSLEDDNSDSYEDMVDTTNHTKKLKLIEQIARECEPNAAFVPRLDPLADSYQSDTTDNQDQTEEAILESYAKHPKPEFLFSRHFQYIQRCLRAQLPSSYATLDANHPWMLYWLYNSYCLVDFPSETDLAIPELSQLIADKIERCVVDEGRGGIAGGANQLGHAAAAYAGVLVLVLSKNYALLHRIAPNLYKWFMSLKTPEGGFRMHHNGESDTRSTYCVLVVSSLLGVVTPELTANTAAWLNSCQTYEGGFAGVPHTEAHGGYTFCALASYFLLYRHTDEFFDPTSFDIHALLRWCASRQYSLEGGLSGRTNKLVDACYSHWIGAVFVLLEIALGQSPLFDRPGLYNYILRCSQSKLGGFRDKPGKHVDFYHTNYALCGLSTCEHTHKLKESESVLAYRFEVDKSSYVSYTEPLNPVFGLPIETITAWEDSK